MEEPLPAFLHLKKEFLSIICPANDVEQCLAVLLACAQLLSLQVCDILNMIFRKYHIEKSNKDILVNLCTKKLLESKIRERINVPDLIIASKICHNAKIFNR